MAKKKIDKLSTWEWSTLVSSWRYYEFRSTIASATFPEDIIERFWGSGKYSDEVLMQIANQFANTDHHNGPACWSDSKCLYDCDKRPWCKFWSFCDALANDRFHTVVMDDNKGHHVEVVAFWCDLTRKWYPRDEYIKHPSHEICCWDKAIKEVR